MSSRFGSSPLSVVPAGRGPASGELDGRYLTRRVEQWFEPAIRRRGADYFRSGEVTSCRGDERALAATVNGSQTYQVVAEVRGPDELGVVCSCPYFVGQNGFCKHLWAVLLQAEQRGLLRQVGGGSNVIQLVDSNRLQRYHEARADPRSAEPRLSVMALRAPSFQSAVGVDVRLDQPTTWQELLSDSKSPYLTAPAPADSTWTAPELIYVLGPKSDDHLWVELWSHEPVPVGSTPQGPLRPAVFRYEWVSVVREPVDREMFLLLGLDREESELSSTRPPSLSGQSAVRIPRTNAPDLVRRLCQTGRCHLGDKTMTLGPALLWVGEEPWRLELELEESATQNGERRPEAHPESAPYLLRGVLVRGTEKQTVQEADFLGCGVVVWGNAAGAYSAEHGSWLEPLSRTGSITVLPEEFGTFIRRYYQASSPAPLRLPPSLALTERACEPQFLLDVLAPDSVTQGLPCQASARYGAQKVSLDARGTKVVDLEDRAVYPRVLEAEQQAKTLLTRLGFRGGLLEVPAGYPCWGPDELRLAKSRLPAAVEALVSAGWRVLAQGKTYRRAGSLAIAVTTGLDWLDLRGGARFEGVHLALPELLSALARRERTVLLDDGTLGLLPEEWLERWGMVADLADPEGMSRGTDHGGGRVRLRRAHVGLLDALLETVEEATWDDAFATLRDELRGFRGLEPAPAPKSFVGTLRPYQAEGLAWLEFVARLGFGGCLADDMGLGKTIQVLALLLKRRAMRHGRSSKTPRSQPSPKTSLIVVPRSLVHNWIEEARRFAPSLRFLSHVGSARDQDLRTLQGYDVLVTSYGTLLRDLEQLRQIEFDCVVLDEAQAIKTAGTQTAKAVRLLRGNVRLALTGTPVENHLGELWSLFDFLNPGLFGAIASWKRSTTRITEGRTAEGESRELLRRTIRPFIVRRTKAAVAKDLPPRSEETLWVELDQEERRRYDDLLAYYQAVVEKRVVAAGVERATPLLLEALLRLRQAACHPGLLDPDQRQNPSAKLEVLLEHLQRLREEGHKALVFSQFTSLLAIVRERLEGLSVQYEYLDGKTRDRPSRVAHFQNDPTVSHFLISLKAGGLGLNLTAADYVFILDPWWNPAVEAQAIDRSHRIGQSRHVFAYRLIARNTVEERVAELQQRKRRLVEAILGEQSGLAGKLTRKDLEFLLG